MEFLICWLYGAEATLLQRNTYFSHVVFNPVWYTLFWPVGMCLFSFLSLTTDAQSGAAV